MRFYVKDSERKPDPEPVKTNAALAIYVGIGAWIIAFIVLLFFTEALAAAEKSWWLLTCGIGVVLGILALFKVRNH